MQLKVAWMIRKVIRLAQKHARGLKRKADIRRKYHSKNETHHARSWSPDAIANIRIMVRKIWSVAISILLLSA